jgi:flagellin
VNVVNSINTNIAALDGLLSFNATTRDLQETQLRINTGLRVRGSSDDVALFAISQNLRSYRKSVDSVKQSLDHAKSVLDVAISSAESISDLINRARELAVQAADLGINTDSRDAISNDFANLMRQIDSQVKASEFNGINLLASQPDAVTAIVSVASDSTISSFGVSGFPFSTSSITAQETYAVGTLDPSVGDNLAELLSSRQIGTNVNSLKNGAGWNLANLLATAPGGATLDSSNGSISITTSGSNYNSSTGEVTFSIGGSIFAGKVQTGLATGAVVTLKPDQFTVKTAGAINVTSSTVKTVGTFDLKNFQDRMGALVAIDNYNRKVKTQLSVFGTASRQLDMHRNFSDKLGNALDTGIGNLVDADLAAESAKLKALQVKQQLGTQSLSIANSAPEAILSLFRQ